MSSREPSSKWRVLLLDTKRSNPNHYICLAVERALKEDSRVEAVFNASLATAIEIARRESCNLFIAFDGEELYSPVCRRLRQVCGIAALWLTEDPYELPVNLLNANDFDLVYTNDSASVASYGGKARHLPLAADRELHYRPVRNEDASYRYDLFFAGTAWPNRTELINNISAAIAGVKLKLALSSNKHLPPISVGMPVSAYSWRTPNSEFASFSNCSRAVLGLHRNFSSTPGARAIAATPGPRIFEVALAGGFQLVDGSLPEIHSYFEVGKEICIFHTPDECVHQLQYYLNNPKERIAIALKGQERALKDHTYAERVDKILTDAGGLISRQISISRTNITGPRRILMVTHNIMGEGSWGGVEVYQDMIASKLGEDYDVWFYYPEPHTAGRVCVLYDYKNKQIRARYKFASDSHPSLLSCPEREATFSSILCKYGFEVVHFQHLINHVPSLPIVSRTHGVKNVLSLHDYYFACHHFNLVGMTRAYCHVEEQTLSGCDVCLSHTLKLGVGSQARRRAFFHQVLRNIDVVHANTAGVAARFKSVYGDIDKRSRLMVMGVASEDLHPRTTREVSHRASKVLRVALIGNLSQIKGAELILPAMAALKGQAVEFTVFGRVDHPYSDMLSRPEYGHVTIHGPYDPKGLPELLTDFDVSLHVSIWPETYCITLSEAWMLGLIPIVSDIGALGERVKHGENGFKFPAGNVGALIDLLRMLASCPEALNEVRTKSAACDRVTTTDHVTWLRNVYDSLLWPYGSLGEYREAGGLTLRDCGLILNSAHWMVDQERGPIGESAPYTDRKLGRKAISYLRAHGLHATLKRAVSELKRRVH